MDSLVLYSNNLASPVNLATFLRIEDGFDVGEAGMYDPLLSQGALYAGRGYGVRAKLREWTLPLRIASGVSGVSNRMTETLIRSNLQRGAFLDFQPFGVPSTEAVRFDIEAGFLEIQHRTRVSDLARSEAMLRLWTQPFGYWPTLIDCGGPITGSQMLSGAPWTFFIPAASIIGDGPIPFSMSYQKWVQATVASSAANIRGNQRLMWSMHGQPSIPSVFSSGFVATSGGLGLNSGINPIVGASLSNPSYGPVVAVTTSMVALISGSYTSAGGSLISPTAFFPIVSVPLASTFGSGSVYVGRYRMVGWARPLGPSTFGWTVAGDVQSYTSIYPPINAYMATDRINTYATVAHPSVANTFANGPSGWSVLDLGEVSIPLAGANATTPQPTPEIILWGRPLSSVASWGTIASFGPSQGIEVGGFGLIPIASNGAFGIISMPGGNSSAVPDEFSTIKVDAVGRGVTDANRALGAYLNGDMPVWDRRTAQGSGICFTFFPYSYPSGAREMGVTSALHVLNINMKYRPTFNFLRGL